MAQPPSAPVIINAPNAETPNQLEYTWYPPRDFGSPATITGYRLTINPGNLVYTMGPVTDFKVLGLTNAQFYSATIEATNDDGLTYGPSASFMDFQTGSLPPVGPSTVTAVALGSDSANITWTPPRTLPDATIFWYYIESRSTTEGDPIISTNGWAFMQNNVIVRGLNSNSTYSFNVQAVNCPGYSPIVTTNSLQFATNFTPANTTGLNIWLDAQDVPTVLSNINGVYQWNDKSGNSNNFGWGTTGWPSVGSIGSSRAITFTNKGLSTNTLAFNNSNYTFFFLNRKLWSAGGTNMLMRGVITSNNNNTTIHPCGFTNEYAFFTSANGTDWNDTSANSPIYSLSTINIAGATVSGSTGIPYYNGIAQNSKNFRTINFDVLTVGFTWDTSQGGQTFFGEIGEVLQYNVTLSPFDRQKVEGYLAWKWGMQTSLPALHPFRSSRPTTTSVFVPSMVSGLQIWIDAQDATTVSLSGSSVTALRDKSANGYIFSNANGFTYNVTLFNTSYPSFYNVNTTTAHHLGSNNAVSFTQPFTTFVVGRMATIGSGFGSYIYDTSTNTNRAPLFNANASIDAGSTTLGAGTNILLNNYLIASVINSGSSAGYLNGNTTSYLSGNPGSFNHPSLLLGNRFSLNTNYNGHLCEIIMYQGTLSTDDRQSVEGYLAWKWGLQSNLPATHPYKTVNPGIAYGSNTIVPYGLMVNFLASTYINGASTWSNLSGYGATYDATVENGSFVKNAAGNGVYFNGTRNFIFANLALGNAWSASLWVKRRGTGGSSACWITQIYSGVNVNLSIHTNGDGAPSDGIVGAYYTSSWRTGTTVTLALDTWYHVTYTYDGIRIRTYVNGVQTGTQLINVPISDAGNQYRIGRRWDSGEYVNGDLGQLLVYNRVISSAENLQNYRATSNVYTV